jgi:hypothetical protein
MKPDKAQEGGGNAIIGREQQREESKKKEIAKQPSFSNLVGLKQGDSWSCSPA